MDTNKPRGRERKVTGTAEKIEKHGQGLGTGPVGSADGHAGRGSSSSGPGRSSSSGPGRSASSGSGRPTSGSGHSTISGTGRPVSGSGHSTISGTGSPVSGPGHSASSGSGRPASSGGGGGRKGVTPTRGGCGIVPIILIVVVLIVIFGGKGLSGLFGGGSAQHSTSATYGTGHSASGSYGSGSYSTTATTGGSSSGTGTSAAGTSGSGTSAAGSSSNQTGGGSSGSSGVASYINSLFGGDPSTYSSSTGTVGEVTAETAGESLTGEDGENNAVNAAAATGSRQKRTKILGSGRDTVTIMVYMCGTDLESRSGMATADLQEMANADLGNLNLIVYTGGCQKWKNSVISNKANQIYQIRNGGLVCLVENAGTGSMTDPATLASFIKWCGTNYPANRNELILWDHGAGSVSGYGYDEKNQRSGSMTLAGINQALSAGGVTFDFIGFDACLMATAENALMLDSYADYMIGSEETEPGVGWYYTEWLTKLASDTSMATTEIGRQIADDFVRFCARRCPGQQTTLSVIDLAEFAYTVPEKLSKFAESVSTMITTNDYHQVSTARNRTREFAVSSRIDQIDLVDLCDNLGTADAQELAKALKSAIKYNTCNYISRASGVSIYFPYQSTSKVDTAVNTYSQSGMDASYAQCIKDFAALETAGQVASGSSGSLLGSLFGSSYSQQQPSTYETDALTELLGQLFGGDLGSYSGLDSSSIGFFSGRSMSDEQIASYISANHFDASELVWERESDGTYRMKLSDGNWKMVEGLDLNVFYDDGSGYIDLGLDNIYGFDEQGRLVANTDKVWLTLDNVVVPYYHESTEDDGENYLITGRIPCLLNGVRSELIVEFDNEHPEGYIAGARTVYKNGETETVAKNLTELEIGDEIQAVGDYYTYDGKFVDAYKVGRVITVSDGLALGNGSFEGQGPIEVTYRFRDIYDKCYWSPVIKVD